MATEEGGTDSAEDGGAVEGAKLLDGPAAAELPPLVPGMALARFTLARRLGAGSMGEVWAADDPQLDRTVAIKVLAPRWHSPRSRLRFLREAQTLASLRHENVVTVYDVGEEGGRLYIAMELAQGETLSSWLRSGSRSWREVRDVFCAAGRGLAAAHAAGIVHRDFKPGNVLVGDAGVRVVDFGLAARGEEPVFLDPNESPQVDDVPLTQTGVLVGTLIYMSPEQLGGERATARSDQWSFCVSLYEALYGRQPFVGATPDALLAAVTRGATFDDGPPRALVAVLRRGLRVAPADRYPSMDALLRDLARDPARARRRWLAAALAVAVVGLAGRWLLARRAVVPSCAGGTAQIAGLWDDAARQRVAEAFRKTGRGYAEETFGRVDAALRARLDRWARAHRETCEATWVRHEQSDALLDRRMRCLSRAQAQIATVVALLGGEKPAIDRAEQAAVQAGDLEQCSDPAAMAVAAPAPRDPETARRVDELRVRRAVLEPFRVLGLFDREAKEAVDILARARELDHPATLAQALLDAGHAHVSTGEVDRGLEELDEAIRIGSRAGDDEVVAMALAEMVFALGTHKARFEAAEAYYRMGVAAAAREGSSWRVLRMLYGYWANTLIRKGDYAGALATLLGVYAIVVADLGADSHQAAFYLCHVATAAGELGNLREVRPLYDRCLGILEKRIGPRHPWYLVHLSNAARNRLASYEVDEAAAMFERRLALQVESQGPESISPSTLDLLAWARYEQRRLDEVRTLVERSIQIRTARLGAGDPGVGASYQMLASVAHREGRLQEAHELFGKAIAIHRAAYGEVHRALVDDHHQHARLLVDLGRVAEARSAVDRALAIEAKIVRGPAERSGPQETLALVLRAERRFREAAAAARRGVALVEEELGSESPGLVSPLTVLCDSAIDGGDAAGAVTAAQRAVQLSAKLSPDQKALARFCLARAELAAEGDRAHAFVLASEARDELAPLAFAARERERVDRWLAALGRRR